MSSININMNKSWQTLIVAGLGVAVVPLDTAVNIALPAITKSFELSVPTIQWIVICYILTYASLLLNCGRWADIAGHHRVFLLGVATSTIALSLCALAPSYPLLLLARVGQAFGAAMILAAGPALVTLAFSSEKRSKALAGYGFAYAMASTLGPLLGGVIIERWGWPAVFWARIPLAITAALLIISLMKTAPKPQKTEQSFDFLGAVLLTIAIIGVLLAINRFGTIGLSGLSLTAAIIGATALILFIRQELTCTAPLIDLSLFRYPAFVGANLAHALGQMAGFVVLLLCPYYLVLAFQNDIVKAGMMLALSPFGMMLASALAAGLLTRFSAHHVSQLGTVLLSLGLLGIGFLVNTTRHSINPICAYSSWFWHRFISSRHHGFSDGCVTKRHSRCCR